MELKIVPFEIKSLDAASGTVEGYGSQFGNVDYGGDVCIKGCYAKTLADYAAKKILPAMRFEHLRHEPVGDWLEMSEDGYGLLTKGKVWTGEKRTDASQKTHNMLTGTGPKGQSIGYITHEYDYDKDGNRLLKELELVEVSIVSFAMNPGAVILSAKSKFFDNGGSIRDIRTVENMLRETCGFSARQAKAFIADGYKGISDLGAPRDAGATDADDLAEITANLHALARKFQE